jgi:hypothetical protein
VQDEEPTTSSSRELRQGQGDSAAPTGADAEGDQHRRLDRQGEGEDRHQHGLAQQVKRDGKGKVVGKKSVANSGAGGEARQLADSRDEQAVAETNEKGEGSLTVTRTDKDKSGQQDQGGRQRPELLERRPHSASATSACHSLDAWNGWCPSPRDKSDWKAAGLTIKQAKGAPGVVNRRWRNS